MTGRLNLWLGLLLLVGGGAFWWLLLDNGHSGAAPHPLSISQLRQLAGRISGQAPTAVEYEIVAIDKLPGDLVVAGTGLKSHVLAAVAFRLVVPGGKMVGGKAVGGKSVVIDSGITPETAKELAFIQYDAAAQARVNAGMASAGTILLTEEHADHVGALLALAGQQGNAGILAHARFNPAQMAQVSLAPDWHWPAGAPLEATLSGVAPEAVAPGVVVIPAPGHSAGSQMVYVRLADGREFLFAGVIAPLASNWQQLRARSRLMGMYREGEQREKVFSWLLTVRQLAAEAPGLVVVPGHDWEWLLDATAAHVVNRGFTIH